jgi:hypothetical protein
MVWSFPTWYTSIVPEATTRGLVMKASKALKRLNHVEDLISDVLERYSAGAPDLREKLEEAKAAATRAKEAVNVQASSEKTSARKKAAVKVRRAKAVKERKSSVKEVAV